MWRLGPLEIISAKDMPTIIVIFQWIIGLLRGFLRVYFAARHSVPGHDLPKS
jgi:hypothetical protein